MSIVCEICSKGMPEGISLFRVNKKGIPGVWRCEEHLQTPINPQVKSIVDAISGYEGPIEKRATTEIICADEEET